MIQNIRKLVPSSYQNKFGFTFYFEGDYVVTKFISMGCVGEVQTGNHISEAEYKKLVTKMIKGVIKQIDKKLENMANNLGKPLLN